MELLFRSKGKEEKIGTCRDIDEAYKVMNSYLSSKGVDYYVTRNWYRGDDIVIDYGSHTSFFILRKRK